MMPRERTTSARLDIESGQANRVAPTHHRNGDAIPFTITLTGAFIRNSNATLATSAFKCDGATAPLRTKRA